MRIFALVASIVLGLLLSDAKAILVASWDTDGQPGGQVSQAPDATAANVSGLNITRGLGLSANGGVDTISSSSWGSTSISPASDTEYFSFGFTIDSGFTVSLDNLEIRTRSSNTGPGTLGLYYNGDSFSAPLFTFNQNGSNDLDSDIILVSLSNLAGIVEFRVIEIGNLQADGTGSTSNSGSFRLENINGNSLSPITFNGTVTAVPEPSAFLFGGLVCSVLGMNFARKRQLVKKDA